jgi:hypothetical protein
METPESLFDRIAKEQASIRAAAASAKRLWYQMETMSQPELAKLFVAICKAGEEYDPNLRYRLRILKYLRTEFLCELVGNNLRVPIALAREIESRFWIVDHDIPGPSWNDGVNVERTE